MYTCVFDVYIKNVSVEFTSAESREHLQLLLWRWRIKKTCVKHSTRISSSCARCASISWPALDHSWGIFRTRRILRRILKIKSSKWKSLYFSGKTLYSLIDFFFTFLLKINFEMCNFVWNYQILNFEGSIKFWSAQYHMIKIYF